MLCGWASALNVLHGSCLSTVIVPLLTRLAVSVIRGFHDVCRYRAYKVTKRSTGSTIVFGCRYHGWRYDTSGALVRAPEFENVTTFRWDENGLLSVNSRISSEGLVFVNFSSSGEEQHFQSDSLKAAVPPKTISPGASLVKEFELEGEFNWKLQSKTSFAEANLMNGTSLAVFPTTSIFWSSTDRYWVSVIHEPKSSKRTQTRFDIYACDSSVSTPERVLAVVEAHAQSYVEELEQLQGQLGCESAQETTLQESLIGRASTSTTNQADHAIAFQNEVWVRTSCHSAAMSVRS